MHIPGYRPPSPPAAGAAIPAVDARPTTPPPLETAAPAAAQRSRQALYAAGSSTAQTLVRSRLAATPSARHAGPETFLQAAAKTEDGPQARPGAASVPSAPQSLLLSVAAGSGTELRTVLSRIAPERIHQIRLSGNDFTATDIASLAILPQLKALKIVCGEALPADAMNAIGGLSALTELDLSTYRALQESDLGIVGKLPHLRKLNLENRTAVNDQSMAYLAQASALEWLSVDSCSISDRSADILAALTSLTALKLNGTAVTGKTLAKLPALEKLTSLGLARCQGIESADVAKLLPALAALEVLDLTMCRNVDNGVFDTVETWPPLRELFAARLEWGDAGLHALAQVPTLEKLVLKLNAVATDEGFRHLARLPSLVYLDLHGCANLSKAGFALPENGRSPIRTLILENCRKIGDAFLTDVAEHLPALERIVLDSCERITATGMRELAKASNLATLSVAYCDNLGDDAMVHIASMRAMDNLNIANCHRVGKDGVESLSALKLRELTISGCAFSDDTMAVLKKLSALEILTAELCYHGRNIYPQTDVTLAYLSEIGSLQQIKLAGNPNMTREGVLKLKNLPNLKKFYFYPSNVPLAQIKEDFTHLTVLQSGPTITDRGPGNATSIERVEEIL